MKGDLTNSSLAKIGRSSFFFSLHVPESHQIVPTAGRENLAIGRKPRCQNIGLMNKLMNLFPCLDIPQSSRPIPTRRSQQTPVRRKLNIATLPIVLQSMKKFTFGAPQAGLMINLIRLIHLRFQRSPFSKLCTCSTSFSSFLNGPSDTPRQTPEVHQLTQASLSSRSGLSVESPGEGSTLGPTDFPVKVFRSPIFQ